VKQKSPSGLSVHAESCFDYLRQSITCNADTNLEPMVPKLYNEHTHWSKRCRDIGSVWEWAEKWKSSMPSKEINEVFNQMRDNEKAVFN